MALQNKSEMNRNKSKQTIHPAQGTSRDTPGSEAKSPVMLKQSWSTSPEELKQLHDEGQILRQGPWGSEETEKLKQNILNYCQENSIKDPVEIIFESGKEKRKDFYKKIAEGITRPLFSVYRRVVRMYDSKNYMGKYSPDELKILKELRKKHGNDWQKMGIMMGRSAASIKDRCRHLKEDCQSGPWKVEEEDRLSEAMFELTQSLPGDDPAVGIPWIQIAKKVGSRSERQCRKKWLSYCNMIKGNKVEWNSEDDLNLVQRLAETGETDDLFIPWVELTQSWPRSSIRSHQWLRAKWRRLRSTIKDHEKLDLKEICQALLMEFTRSNKVQMIEIPLSCVTHIPLYMCTVDGQNISYVTDMAHEVEFGADDGGVVVAHMDLDGGEEPAVTTDVMLSGSSLCAHGSPYGLDNNKLNDDDESEEHSRSSK